MSTTSNQLSGSSSRLLRVSVIEDDPVVREHLVNQLNSAPGFICVSSHSSAETALEEVVKLNPAVVLTDINLPQMSGIECVRQLKKRLPAAQFVMLTVYEDANSIFKSLLAGAVGYLLKGRSGSGEKVLEAVRDAAGGGAPLNSLIARKIIQHFQRQSSPLEQLLTPRERQVLELLSKGMLYKEISDTLEVSMDTVRKHCHHIYEKLQVQTRTEAVLKYLGK